MQFRFDFFVVVVVVNSEKLNDDEVIPIRLFPAASMLNRIKHV